MKKRDAQLRGRATIRRVENAGFEPVRYHTDEGFLQGWIVTRGTKLIHVYLISLDQILKVPKSEARFMTPVTRHSAREIIAKIKERQEQPAHA